MTQLALINTDDTPQVEVADYIPKEVAFVKPFEQQIALIEGELSKFVFDYSNPADNEKARSLIRKLQKSRAAIEKIGKAERDPAVKYQAHVISEERKLTVRVQAIIDQYDKPLKEWEAKDQLRKDTILGRIRVIRPDAEYVLTASTKELQLTRDNVEAINPDEGFDEFSSEAFAARITTLEYLKEHITIAEKREADAARLAQLEADALQRRIAAEAAAQEKAAQEAEAARLELAAKEEAEAAQLAKKQAEERAAYEQRLKDEAAAAAKAAAEAESAAREQKLKDEKAAAERAAAEQAEKAARELREAEERRAREAKEAEERQAAAVAAEQKRIADETAKKQAEDDRRAADKAHRAKVNNEVLGALVSMQISDDAAKAIITAIALGKVPHLTINY